MTDLTDVSIIIPVLNESQRVMPLVHFFRAQDWVREVIVVDDGSTDGTGKLARVAGATVITSTMLGKGASLHDGLLTAKSEVVIFVDGDLSKLPSDLIDRITQPLINGKADLVKARWTCFNDEPSVHPAKQLLQTYFPKQSHFARPFNGILAAHRRSLESIGFETDYGVDVGLLIDATELGLRLTEVDIGEIEHDATPSDVLSDATSQRIRTIMDRAARSGCLDSQELAQQRETEHRTKANLPWILRNAGNAKRLALFNMDRVLLEGDFASELARRLGRTDELLAVTAQRDIKPDAYSRAVAAVFKNVPREILEQTAREAPLTEGAADAVIGLRTLGYRVGIITNSFLVVADTIRRRVFADFSVAHVMKYAAGRATGEILLSSAMMHPQGCSRHHLCKANALRHLTSQMSLSPSQVLAVGCDDSDVCLLESVGLSFAFRPITSKVASAAKHILLAPIRTLVDNAVIMSAKA